MAEGYQSTVFECDHMRPVVHIRLPNGSSSWFHIGHDGYAAGECTAGVYKVKAQTQTHAIGRLVRDDD